VVSAAHNEGIWISMCGEMASDPLHGLLLVGLGFDELSMTPASIPLMKRIIRSVTYGQAAEVALRVLGCPTAKEVEEFLRLEMRARFPEYFVSDLSPSPEGRPGFP
jgi:phosphotransferase system enzyme I (PtsI)